MAVRLCVIVRRVGPYHCARMEALSRFCDLLVVEFSNVDATYYWNDIGEVSGVRRETLFRGKAFEGLTYSEVWQKLSRVLAKFDPDVVAIPGWSHRGALMALRWCRRNDVPTVVMSDSRYQDAPRRSLKEIIKKTIVSQFSAGLVAGTEHIDYVHRLGIPKSRIFVGYDVVDNRYFETQARSVRTQRDSQRRSAKLPNNFFLAVCRFIEEKNLFRLLEAFAQYRDRFPAHAWDLVLLGEGPLKPALEATIEKHNLVGAVHLPGFAQYEVLPTYYGLAGGLVHASTSDTWGLVVNEAMAASLPVIVSNRCGCADDLVCHGRNGFVFDPYNVEELIGSFAALADPRCDRKGMGAASREMIKAWSPIIFAENMIKAADAAMEAPRRRPRRLLTTVVWPVLAWR